MLTNRLAQAIASSDLKTIAADTKINARMGCAIRSVLVATSLRPIAIPKVSTKFTIVVKALARQKMGISGAAASHCGPNMIRKMSVACRATNP